MSNKQSEIYFVGDSHVSVFLGVDKLAPIWPAKNASVFPFFKIIRLGPITAYNISQYNTTTNGRENLEKVLENIPLNAWILFSAGEIDCRVHLIKQCQIQNKSFEDVADIVAKRYISFISEITRNRFKIGILLPPPSSFLVEEGDLSYPKFGSEVERNKMTKVLIEKLIERCSSVSIPTINVFKYAIHADFTTKKKFLWDGIHLSTHALPIFINQINAITGYNLHMPLKWLIRERLRKIKHTFNTN